MKKSNIFILIVIGILNIHCNKNTVDDSNIENLKVEQFVLSLKQSTYTSGSLPDFTPDDIPALLKYANDFYVISYYPSSNICSYANIQFKLGECILWTIEAIRTKYPYENSFSRFPSCVPMIIHNKYLIDAQTSSGIDPAKYRLNNNQLIEVYKAYQEWWRRSNSKKFDEIKNINPLKELDFIWY